MINEFDELMSEFKSLRRGRGLDAPDLKEKLGRRLRLILGLDFEGKPGELRRELGRRIEGLAATLPSGPRQAVLVAYGLTPDSAGARFLKERVQLLAGLIDRDARTANRRIDEGLAMIVEAALAEHRQRLVASADRASPWRTTALRTSVALDQRSPEVFEVRRVMASADGIDEIELEASTPAASVFEDEVAAEKVSMDVLYGGTIRGRTRRSSSRVAYALRLPRKLPRYGEHEIFLRFRFADEHSMRPFYVCTPEFPCERFELRVKFPSRHGPGRVWRIDGLLPFEVEDSLASREAVDVDPCGEVHVVFADLTPNRSYGVSWSTTS